MATLKFFTRTEAKNKLVNLRVRFTDGRVDGKPFILYGVTPKKLDASHWNEKKQKVRDLSDATYKDDITFYITGGKDTDGKDKTGLAPFILAKYSALKERPSKDWLQRMINLFDNPHAENENPLLKELENYITENRNSVNTNWSYKTLNVLLSDFNKNVSPVSFETMDLNFLPEFLRYLDKKGYTQNSQRQVIKTLKSFLNKMYSRGINHNLKFKFSEFTVEQKKNDLNIYLSHDEIAKIAKLKLEGTDDIVRDWLIVACYTALRHSDWKQLQTKDLTKDYIELTAQKTGGKLKIPVHPIVRRIFAKYNYQMPHAFVITTTNKKIRKIVKAAGIDTKFIMGDGSVKEKWELCCSHIGRRSMATNAYDDEMPLKKIMAVTGHKTISQLLDYIKKSQDDEVKDVLAMWQNDPRFAVNQ